ncbi:hypothetical protein SKAU_G00240140 [Synaphobranchus kaupii]|uniref:Uncharacterized protein n=1 Tax=Synaphobranchus kaupii TaxID=118154 RepID=A0A9Q1IS53_SYNKA|nr:hypothetical protein SKAU_G00240140 [Synaphobranchus kaupii]
MVRGAASRRFFRGAIVWAEEGSCPCREWEEAAAALTGRLQTTGRTLGKTYSQAPSATTTTPTLTMSQRQRFTFLEVFC